VSDVLVISVPVDGAYAGVNDVAAGWGAAKKSPAYLSLFRDVREAARAEMTRTGWETATYACAVEVVRYYRTLRIGDADGLAKVPIDALSPSTPHQEARDRSAPFAGVWVNDRLARPLRADVEYDPDGEDRLVIVVRRRFPDPLAAEKRPRSARRTPMAANTPPAPPAPARPAQAAKTPIRTLAQLRSGDTLSLAERDALLESVGVQPKGPR
jgi:hypothetical protein